jgi:long-chain acyl-CoA synthetase
MPQHIKLELLRALPPHTQLVVMYGATEASARLTCVPPRKLKAKIDSIGVPIPEVTIQVLSPEGNKVKPGTVGELVARGPNIMLGYYKDEAGTRKVLDRHGYHTGDLGFYDGDGFLFLTGRKDDQIKVGGHRINPREIEDVVMDSGLAIECIVFPVPDSYQDSRLAGLAVPVSETDGTAKRILDYCRRKLPKYQVPGSLEMVDAIPKNGTGKPDRRESLELFLKKHDGGNG